MSDPETTYDKAEYEAQHEAEIAGLEALDRPRHVLTALVDGECDDCGLNYHVGDDIVLGERGYVHPTCGELEQYAADLQAEWLHDLRREREG